MTAVMNWLAVLDWLIEPGLGPPEVRLGPGHVVPRTSQGEPGTRFHGHKVSLGPGFMVTR
jgi:hypothetical protein